jgi:hypothetical protein
MKSPRRIQFTSLRMKPYRKFNDFQIRWREVLKQGDVIYLHRWTLVVFGYSIRLHHWLGDDVGPHLHNHSCDFISLLFWGKYINVTQSGEREIKAPFIWYSKAQTYHRLKIGENGAWTLLFCGKPRNKWGFDVNGYKWRPLRYFAKFGSSN